jgi:iron complex outermembrane receptor protein
MQRWMRGAALLLLTAAPAAAQQGVAYGVVRDGTTGDVITEADMTSGSSRARTTPDGKYRLERLGAGQVDVSVRRVGYLPVTKRVVVAPGVAVEVNFDLTASATTLETMVVTATRDEKSLRDVPAAVTAVDTAVIESGRTAGLNEVLRYTPGILAQSRYGGDDVNLSVRGSGIRTTFGVRGVAVLLDGVPITEPDGLTRLDLIELAQARQVEVVRGPASALYGGVASGGAVNIISRTGQESRGANVRVQNGAFGFEKYDGYVGTTFNSGKGSVLLSGARTNATGFREFNRNEMTRFNLRTEWKPALRTRLSVDASTSNLDMNIPGALTEGEFVADPNQANPVNVTNQYARRDERYRAGMRLDQGLGAEGTLQTTSYLYYGGRTLDHPIFQVIDQNLHRVQMGTRLQAPIDRRDDPRVLATAGVDYDHLFGTDKRFVNQGGVPGAARADGYLSLPNLGLYGVAEARVAAPLTLSAGLRYDRVEYNIDNYLDPTLSGEKVFDQVSPKFSAAYRAGAGTTLYASVARGFEVPTSGELTASPNVDQAINDSLVPKSLWNYEVGAKTLIGSALVMDVAVFYADITGEFLSRTVPTPTGPRPIFENAGASRNIGVELGWTALLTKWLDFTGSYTFADYELTDFQSLVVNEAGQSVLADYSGNRLPGVPVHRFGGEFRFRPVKALLLGVGGEWQSKTYVDNANTESGNVYFRSFGSPVVNAVPFSAVPAWGIVNLNARYAIGPATIFGNVENLFNKTYVANAVINDGTGRFYNAGSGRFAVLGVSVAAFPGGF